MVISERNCHINIDSLKEITYINNNLRIKITDKKLLHKYIVENMTKDKLIGNIILEELIQKVFHPDRLSKIADKYNIDVSHILDLY